MEESQSDHGKATTEKWAMSIKKLLSAYKPFALILGTHFAVTTLLVLVFMQQLLILCTALSTGSAQLCPKLGLNSYGVRVCTK